MMPDYITGISRNVCGTLCRSSKWIKDWFAVMHHKTIFWKPACQAAHFYPPGYDRDPLTGIKAGTVFQHERCGTVCPWVRLLKFKWVGRPSPRPFKGQLSFISPRPKPPTTAKSAGPKPPRAKEMQGSHLQTRNGNGYFLCSARVWVKCGMRNALRSNYYFGLQARLGS